MSPTLTRAPDFNPRPLGSLEFPFDAAVANTGLGKAYESLSHIDGALVQGGQITSYTFPTEVESVQVLLKTYERNMKALIELTQGPNQVKQFIEVYASVGYKNPFYCVIQTPGSNNAIRIVNQVRLRLGLRLTLRLRPRLRPASVIRVIRKVRVRVRPRL